LVIFELNGLEKNKVGQLQRKWVNDRIELRYSEKKYRTQQNQIINEAPPGVKVKVNDDYE